MTDHPTPTPPAEARWIWRRLYVFATTLALWRLVAGAIVRIEPQALPAIVMGLLNLLGLTLVLYLVAPTAQQLTALLSDLRLRPRPGRGAGAPR